MPFCKHNKQISRKLPQHLRFKKQILSLGKLLFYVPQLSGIFTELLMNFAVNSTMGVNMICTICLVIYVRCCLISAITQSRFRISSSKTTGELRMTCQNISARSQIELVVRCWENRLCKGVVKRNGIDALCGCFNESGPEYNVTLGGFLVKELPSNLTGKDLLQTSLILIMLTSFERYGVSKHR